MVAAIIQIVRTIFFLACFSFILFFSSPVKADEPPSCNTVPNPPFDSPANNTPFENCKQDCGCPHPDYSPWFYDDINYHSTVKCVENPELMYKLAFNDASLIDKIKPTGKVSVSYALEFNDSFSIKSENFSKLNPAQLANILSSVGLPDRFDDTLCDSLCVYHGIYDQQECAAKLETLTQSGTPNTLACTWFNSRTSTLKERFETQKKRMQHIFDCDNNPLAHRDCDQNYTVDSTDGTKAYDVAAKYRNFSYEQFQKLKDSNYKDYLRILSLRASRASSPVCIVIEREKNPAKTSIFDIIFGNTVETEKEGEKKSFYLCGFIPGVPASREASQNMFAKIKPKSVGDDAISEISDMLNRPVKVTETANGRKNVEDFLYKKIKQAGIDCAGYKGEYQTMGGQGEARSTNNSGGGQTLSIPGSFTIKPPDGKSVGEAAQTPMYIYRAYVIAPTEEIAQYTASHPDSFIKNLFTKDKAAAASRDPAIPLPATNTPPSAHTDSNPQTTTKLVPCPSGQNEPCYETATVDARVDYQAGNNILAGIPGGSAINSLLLIGHRLSWSKTSDAYFHSMCWAQTVARKLESTPLLGNSPLFELIGRTVDAAASKCPTDGSSSSGNYMCSGTEGKPLISASGSCGLCNLDQFPYGDIPASMKEVIESAAQENNVPAGLIIGILAAEGGFEREQVYGEWTNELVCADSIPNCESGNVSGAGAKGPYQIVGTWNEGNACNFTDASRIAADVLAKGKPGNPCWVSPLYRTSSVDCGAVDQNYSQYQDIVPYSGGFACSSSPTYQVNAGTGNRPSSCSGWSDADIITAARAYRGMCHPEYFDMVLNYAKKFSCN